MSELLCTRSARTPWKSELRLGDVQTLRSTERERGRGQYRLDLERSAGRMDLLDGEVGRHDLVSLPGFGYGVPLGREHVQPAVVDPAVVILGPCRDQQVLARGVESQGGYDADGEG